MEARWALAAFLASFVFMIDSVSSQLATTDCLGLAHVVFWTPLVLYLYARLTNLVGPRLFERWIRILLATNGVSLVVDYVDVLRYVMGDRG